MAYKKKTWVSEEIITKEAMNNIEEGTVEAGTRLTNLETSLNSLSIGVHEDGGVYLFIDGVPVGEGIFFFNGYAGSTQGFIDTSNNMMLPEDMAAGVYTLKYENEDGTYTTICDVDVTEEGE